MSIRLKTVLALTLVSSFSLANPVYDDLLTTLESPSDVGVCKVWSEGLEHDGQFLVHILKDNEDWGFMINNPDVDHDSHVSFKEDTLTYKFSQSDMIGYARLFITVDAAGKIVALRTDKILPLGKVYSVGAECGN